MTSKKRARIKKKGPSTLRLPSARFRAGGSGLRAGKRKKRRKSRRAKSIVGFLILIIILLLILLIIESGQIFLQFRDLTKKVVDNQQSVSPVYIVDSQSIDFDVYLREHFANKVPKKTMQVTVSAYSSTDGQTDDTPYLTAFGTHVRDGIVAANFLPVGTVVRFPDKFGDKLFVVEDRMDERFSLQVDIWMSDQEEAKRFGIQYLNMEIF